MVTNNRFVVFVLVPEAVFVLYDLRFTFLRWALWPM
jgi:hypothetical protein